MDEDYVSLGIAKLLKKKGFDWECRNVIAERVPISSVRIHDIEKGKMICEIYQRPSLYVAQKWLREEKNIIILLDCYPSHGYFYIIVKDGKTIFDLDDVKSYYEYYEDALETGIYEALLMI